MVLKGIVPMPPVVENYATDLSEEKELLRPGMIYYGLKKVPFLWKFYLLQVLISLLIICMYLYFMPIMSPPIFFSMTSFNQYLRLFNRSESISNKPQVRAMNRSMFSNDESHHSDVHQKGINDDSVPTTQKLPSCIIFGVSKGGTRAALEYIKLHPDVRAPSKEIHFFDNDTLQQEPFGLSWYLQQMPAAALHQIIVEKSPDYFQHPHSARRIYAANNNTKLILLLRDPVERLVSEYMQLVEKNPLLPRFETWVTDANTGDVNTRLTSVMVSAYSDFLAEWLEVFPIDRIHIIESYNLRVNPLMEMKFVERFLNLRPYLTASDFYYNVTRGFYCNRLRATGVIKCLGKSKGRNHIPVRQDVMDKLYKFYYPYNMKLNRLLGMSFPWSRGVYPR